MKKLTTMLLLLLNVTNSTVFANCITGYACSIKDLEENNTNSVIQKENETLKTNNKIKNIDPKSTNKDENKKTPPNELKEHKQITNSIF